MEYEVLFAVQLEAENKQELYNKAERISKSMNMYLKEPVTSKGYIELTDNIIKGVIYE